MEETHDQKFEEDVLIGRHEATDEVDDCGRIKGWVE